MNNSELNPSVLENFCIRCPKLSRTNALKKERRKALPFQRRDSKVLSKKN